MTTWLHELSYEVQSEVLYDGVQNNQAAFFMMNDKCYILDGANYLVYDGVTIQPVTPYIPTLTVSREPAGGGAPYEDFNLLGAGFKDSFSADGTAKEFQLSLSGLDATAIIAEVNGVAMVETTHFTVDRVTGKVTFIELPAKGVNNVIITAYKTIAGLADRIKKCRFHTAFGGSNDTRIFLSGNPDMPEYVWRLGLYDPTYAPENGFYRYPGKVKGFSKQFDYLVVHRENGAHVINFEIVDGIASFPSRPVNDQVGTLATMSIQIVENNPVFLSKNGVYMLTASNVRDERNVSHLSDRVDKKLLREPNLENAVSFDYDRKYFLAVNGKVYIFDYAINEWYLYDNIPVSQFIEIDSDLYFGSSQEGLLYRFKREDESLPYNDDESPINAYWASKYLTFGADESRKLIEKVFYSLKPNSKTSADLYYVTNKKTSDLIKTSRMDLFDFHNMNFADFVFLSSVFPQEVATKIKAKKVTHFQLRLENNKMDESLGILSLAIKYRYQSYIK